jgi:hypothetical protein
VAALLTCVGCGTHNVSDQTAIPLQTTDTAVSQIASQSTPDTAVHSSTAVATAVASTPTSTEPNGGAPSGGSAPNGGVSPDDQKRSGGDEEGTRIPAAFSVATGAADPARVTVSPFLDVELDLHSVDGKPHVFTLVTSRPITVSVPATGTLRKRVGSFRAGTYAIRVDGRDTTAQLVVADAEGP